MSYIIEVTPSCQRNINKACKKNPVLRRTLQKKMREIILNPLRYKPLMHALTGWRRVHIMKSFVLIFKVDKRSKAVTFIAFSHHDDAYKR